MIKFLVGVLLIFYLSGCSTLKSTETFAVCKTLDIATTAHLIRTGVGEEANPFVKPLIANGYFPLILLSTIFYLALKEHDNPDTNVMVNSITCTAAVSNLSLIK